RACHLRVHAAAPTEIYTLSLHDALPTAWAFRYRTPDGVTDVPVGQPPQDRDAGWVRDLPGEARLLDTLVLPPGLPRLRATPPARGPEPVVELRRLDTAHLARVGLPRLREDNPELVVEVHGEAPDYRLVETAPTVRLTATDSTEGDW